MIDILENYPGNVERKDSEGKIIAPARSGFDLIQDMVSQAEAFGAVITGDAAVELKKEENVFTGVLSGGGTVKAQAVIIATGAAHRSLNVPGEKEFTGRGVSYCATCDGAFFRSKKIFVAGGGDAACDEAQYLSRLSDNIIMVHRRDRFRAQKALAERVMRNQNIEVRFNTVIKEIKGDKKVSSVVLEHRSHTGAEVYEETADAVFIFVGFDPQSSLVSGLAELDSGGYIITNQKMASSVPGLFAAGDVRSGTFRQVIVAAGEGAVAARNAEEYIDELRGTVYK
jgi:thioredoxin reductase (NADPH)